MLSVLVINGPNLGRLGSREPEVYGNTSYDQLVSLLDEQAAVLGIGVEVRQSDSETDLVHWIHEAVDANRPVVLNPAAFTHYSYALRDACAMMTAPLIEVHLSNPAAREEFRQTSVISGVATGTIAGFGAQSYVLALHALVSLST